MRRKLFTFFLALVAGVGTMFAENVQIGDLYYNLNATNKTAEVTYKSYANYRYNEGWNITTADIPASVTYSGTTYSVTSIGRYAFSYCSSLTSVTIPNSVTSIGYSAFAKCTGLTSVTIPNSVTSIGEYAFSDCSGLPVVDNLRYADTYLVEAVDKTLSSYTIRNGTKWIGSSAFYGCRSLTSVTIPNSVTSIGDEAFANCTGLTSVTIPNSVTSIGELAFEGCSSLTSVTIGNSVTSIGYGVFYGCSSLTSLTIPNSVTSIGIEAFYGCSSLTAIYVPCGEMERFKQMLDWEYQDKVKYAPLPYTITINAAEHGNVTYPQTMCDDMSLNATPDYGYHFVQWSDGVTDNPRTIELTQDTTFTAEFAKNTYTISTTSANPEWGTTAGGKSALYLDEVEISAIPNYGYHFVQWSDGNTSNPRTISVTEDKAFTAIFAEDTYFVKIEDLYYNLNVPDKTAEVCGLTGKIRIDDNSIDDWNMLPTQYVAQATCPADAAMTGLKSVKVYADAKYINILVEPNMDDLPDLSNVPFRVYLNTDNSDATGGYGDQWNDANTDIMLEGALFAEDNPYNYNPAVFKWWGEVGGDGWAWQDPNVGHDESDCWGAIVCEGQLRCSSQYVNGKFEIQIDRTHIPATWNTTEFGIGFGIQQNWTEVGVLPCISPTDNNPAGKTAKLQVTIDNTPYAEISGDIVIPETVNYDGVTYSVTSIGNYAFYGCSGLTSVTIPNSVTSIGEWAFKGCSSLTSVEAPAGFFDIPEYSWSYCTKILNHVTVNGGELTENALLFINRSYKTLQTLDVSGVTNTEFADEAFKGYYNLQQLVLPAGLQKVGYMMVAGCKNLQSIDIPASVEEIEQSAFEDCRSIQSITFGGAAGAPGRAAAPAASSQLKKIGNWAFYNAHELQHLNIPEGVEEIGDGAFYGCTYLEDMVLPSSIRAIGDNCFALCGKLTKIVCNATTPPAIQAKTFYDVNRLIPVYVPDESVASYESDEYWQEFDIQGASDIESAVSNMTNDSATAITKVMRNGQVLILRDGKTYTIQGVEVK